MSRESLPWPEMHRPKTTENLVGNTRSIQELRRWILSWSNNIPRKRGALLIGPPGVGKTAAVGALANDLNMELVEFNASDKRNKSSIEKQVWRAATQQTIDGRRRLLLLDEVDGLSGTSDRGGIGAIKKILDLSVHPIVMTANDPKSRKLKRLRKKSLVLHFKPIEPEDMLVVLDRIASAHEGKINKGTIKRILENSEGDLRAAISDLETVMKAGSIVGMNDVSPRNVRRDVEDTLRRLFMSTDTKSARRVVSQGDASYDDLLLWLEENLHLHLRKNHELEAGLDAVSNADLFLGRIMRDQEWKLLSYVYDFLSAGMATSRTETPFRRVEYSRPSWPLMVWKGNRSQKKYSDILSRISNLSRVSTSRVMKTHGETISTILKRNPKLTKEFSEWLNVKSTSIRKMANRH
ncbi:MAG: replication factor C large subunit [Candidatus Thorarchaeota archaeon]|nr:replication factor C large subunit [Candidatus Thorarchaeota archaeon]